MALRDNDLANSIVTSIDRVGTVFHTLLARIPEDTDGMSDYEPTDCGDPYELYRFIYFLRHRLAEVRLECSHKDAALQLLHAKQNRREKAFQHVVGELRREEHHLRQLMSTQPIGDDVTGTYALIDLMLMLDNADDVETAKMLNELLAMLKNEENRRIAGESGFMSSARTICELKEKNASLEKQLKQLATRSVEEASRLRAARALAERSSSCVTVELDQCRKELEDAEEKLSSALARIATLETENDSHLQALALQTKASETEKEKLFVHIASLSTQLCAESQKATKQWSLPPSAADAEFARQIATAGKSPTDNDTLARLVSAVSREDDPRLLADRAALLQRISHLHTELEVWKEVATSLAVERNSSTASRVELEENVGRICGFARDHGVIVPPDVSRAKLKLAMTDPLSADVDHRPTIRSMRAEASTATRRLTLVANRIEDSLRVVARCTLDDSILGPKPPDVQEDLETSQLVADDKKFDYANLNESVSVMEELETRVKNELMDAAHRVRSLRSDMAIADVQHNHEKDLWLKQWQRLLELLPVSLSQKIAQEGAIILEDPAVIAALRDVVARQRQLQGPRPHTNKNDEEEQSLRNLDDALDQVDPGSLRAASNKGSSGHSSPTTREGKVQSPIRRKQSFRTSASTSLVDGRQSQSPKQRKAVDTGYGASSPSFHPGDPENRMASSMGASYLKPCTEEMCTETEDCILVHREAQTDIRGGEKAIAKVERMTSPPPPPLTANASVQSISVALLSTSSQTPPPVVDPSSQEGAASTQHRSQHNVGVQMDDVLFDQGRAANLVNEIAELFARKSRSPSPAHAPMEPLPKVTARLVCPRCGDSVLFESLKLSNPLTSTCMQTEYEMPAQEAANLPSQPRSHSEEREHHGSLCGDDNTTRVVPERGHVHSPTEQSESKLASRCTSPDALIGASESKEPPLTRRASGAPVASITRVFEEDQDYSLAVCQQRHRTDSEIRHPEISLIEKVAASQQTAGPHLEVVGGVASFSLAPLEASITSLPCHPTNAVAVQTDCEQQPVVCDEPPTVSTPKVQQESRTFRDASVSCCYCAPVVSVSCQSDPNDPLVPAQPLQPMSTVAPPSGVESPCSFSAGECCQYKWGGPNPAFDGAVRALCLHLRDTANQQYSVYPVIPDSATVVQTLHGCAVLANVAELAEGPSASQTWRAAVSSHLEHVLTMLAAAVGLSSSRCSLEIPFSFLACAHGESPSAADKVEPPSKLDQLPEKVTVANADTRPQTPSSPAMSIHHAFVPLLDAVVQTVAHLVDEEQLMVLRTKVQELEGLLISATKNIPMHSSVEQPHHESHNAPRLHGPPLNDATLPPHRDRAVEEREHTQDALVSLAVGRAQSLRAPFAQKLCSRLGRRKVVEPEHTRPSIPSRQEAQRTPHPSLLVSEQGRMLARSLSPPHPLFHTSLAKAVRESAQCYPIAGGLPPLHGPTPHPRQVAPESVDVVSLIRDAFKRRFGSNPAPYSRAH